MKTVQDLRDKRTALHDKASKLNQDNPGSKFTHSIMAEFDETLAAIDAIDREIIECLVVANHSNGRC